jgi:DNA-binding beta-propeller fold protein YncE
MISFGRIGMALGLFCAAVVPGQDLGDCVFSTGRSQSLSGQNTTFQLLCPTSPKSVAWEFGDGTKLDSGSSRAEHIFSQPGHFLVVARAEGYPFLATQIHTVGLAPTVLAPTHASPLVYDVRRHRIFVVNRDLNTVSALDAVALKKIWEMPVAKNPRTLALDTSGNIWVTCQDDAVIAILNGLDGKNIKTLTLPYGSRPYGIAFKPGTNLGYITLEATGHLLQVDGNTLTVIEDVDIAVKSRALAITSEGRIFVGSFISPADHGEVLEITPSPLGRKGVLRLAMDPGPDNEANSRGVPNALSDIVITPDGRWAWVASKKDNVERGRFRENLDLTFETTVRSIVSQIDLEKNQENLGRRKDFNDQSLPTAIAFTRNSGYALVAHAGSNNIAVIDAWDGSNVFSLEARDLGSDRAPEGLAVDENDSLLFVLYFLSREVGVYDIRKLGIDQTQVRRIATLSTSEHETLPENILRGKKIFYNAADPRMSKERYNSCVVCHMDGGTDGRVWDFTQRGEGLRRTTSLLGRAGTGMGPAHWSANFDEIQDFEHDIRGPFGGLGFIKDQDFNAGTHNQPLGDKKAGLSPELDDLAAYVSSLAQVHPSPYRNADGSLTADGIAGKVIFNRPDVGCARCHSGPQFTDSRLLPKPDSLAGGLLALPGGFLLHDVGTRKPASGQRLKDSLPGFDTPTLKGIWEFSPYLHDGSANTLMEVITTANLQDRHGKTSQLSMDEKLKLVAYLQQLDESESSPLALRPLVVNAPNLFRLWVTGGTARGELIFHAEGIPANARLSISIYTPEGRSIRVLEDKSSILNTNRTLIWNGQDSRNQDVNYGLFYMRARAGSRNSQGPFIYTP